SDRIMKPPIVPVEYPESDGKPMANNTRHGRLMTRIYDALDALYRDNPQVFVAIDLFWYAVEGDPSAATAPDVMVVFGRPRGDRPSYLQWEEANIAPQVVFEIRSPTNDDAEMEEKFAFYNRHRVEEYYLYDPDAGTLEGWERGARRLVPVASMQGHI